MNFKKIAMVAMVGSLSCLALTGCGNKAINLNKYAKIEVSGYDGYGIANISIDEDALNEAMKNIKYKNHSEYALLFGDASEYIQDLCISYSLDEYNGLSNGDEITLKWDIEDSMVENATNAKLKYKDMTIKVEGLKEATTFDAFAGVDVEFSGTAPNGTATIIEGIVDMPYKLDKSSGLSNGDIVTVMINDSFDVNKFLKKYGALPAEMERKFTVTGLTGYATTFSEISEDMQIKMDTQARRLIAASQGSFDDPSTGFSDEAELIGTYFKTLLNKNSWNSEKNIAGLVYKLYAKDMVTGEKFSYYWYVEFSNVMILPDGSTSVDISQADYPVYEYSWWTESGTYFKRSEYSYAGYDNLDSLIYNRLTAYASEYDYTSDITE